MPIDTVTQQRSVSRKSTLTLQDFDCGIQDQIDNEYLSLSFTRLNGHTYVRITTIDAQPITYMAVILSTEDLNLEAVRFEMQAR